MNTGTKTRARTPIENRVVLSLSLRAFVGLCTDVAYFDGEVISPLTMREANKRGTTMETRLGMNRFVINGAVLIFPSTQSMIVVTSPIGDQAPPLFAAIIIILANTHLSL